MRSAAPRAGSSSLPQRPPAWHGSGGAECRAAARHRALAARCAAPADGSSGDVAPPPAAADERPSAPPCPLRAFSYRSTLRNGAVVVVRPAAGAQEGSVLTTLLADVFASSLNADRFRRVAAAGSKRIARGTAADSLPRRVYLARKVEGYVVARMATPPRDAVLLVALAEPGDDAGGSAGAESAFALLGVCEVSLSPDTRSHEDRALQPPPHGAYCKNMSVALEHRRRGVGAALLAAAEAYATAAADTAPPTPPFQRLYRYPVEMFLHVAVADAVARALYVKAGYQTVAEQSALAAALRRSGPRVALMRKRLRD